MGETVLTGDYTKSNAVEDFLLIDDGVDNKIMVFATKQFLRLLSKAGCVYMDGTFYTAPKDFVQFYSMHVMVDDAMILCVYALLPDKSRVTYVGLFQVC